MMKMCEAKADIGQALTDAQSVVWCKLEAGVRQRLRNALSIVAEHDVSVKRSRKEVTAT